MKRYNDLVNKQSGKSGSELYHVLIESHQVFMMMQAANGAYSGNEECRLLLLDLCEHERLCHCLYREESSGS